MRITRLFVFFGLMLFLGVDVFAKADVEVTGIIHKDTPMAIINDKILQEGDEIDGYLLEKIGNNFVNLRYKNKLIVKNVTGKRLPQDSKLTKIVTREGKKDKKLTKFQRGAFPLMFSLVVLLAGGITFLLSNKNKNQPTK